MTELQKKALAEVCYLPEETIERGASGAFGLFTWKLTVNAGFE